LLRGLLRSGIAVALGAASLIGALPGVAHAECSTGDWPPPADVAAYRGHLFEAAVVQVAPATEGRADWYATLRVERQYRGSTADPLQLHGSSVGCSHLDGSRLRVGDTLMVSIDRMDASLYGPLLVWRRAFDEGVAGDGWRRYDPVLSGSDSDYPAAARGRLSTNEILAIFGPGTLPETDAATVPDDGRETEPAAALVLLIGIVAFVVASGMLLRLRQSD
jgi:hypothetical protein